MIYILPWKTLLLLAIYRKNFTHSTMQKYPYLVIEKEGRVYGYAYAGPFKERAAYDWACELSIYVDHAAKKCGLG